MSEVNAKFSFYAGNSRSLKFTVLDKDTTGNPAKNLSGAVMKWALSRTRNGKYNKTAVLEKSSTVPGDITMDDAATGVIIVNLTDADTASLLGDYYYELEMVEGGSTEVVATGELEILRNVENTL